MRWRLIDKTNVKAPATGSYRSWKPKLADEASLQCVYCCIHENRFGGLRNFHVEHYKPQSIFPALENNYDNLFYACGVCNVFKSDDWPCEHQPNNYNVPAYPNPAVVDYGTFLNVNLEGYVVSDSITGRYVIERLSLNRPQMVGLRAITRLMIEIESAEVEIRSMLSADAIAPEYKDNVIEFLLKSNEILRKFNSVRPYGSDQLKRN